MKLLLTNDDGVDAAGLAALRSAVEALGEPVTVAPAGAFSGCSHRVTTDQAFRVRRRDATCYVVEGTPADCVRVALGGIAPDTAWVLSGINHGGNLGADVHISGTVAAIREGVLHGWPGIAVSHYHRKGIDEIDWLRAARWVGPIIRDLIERPLLPGQFWNINLPHLERNAADPPVEFCPLDRSPLPVSFHSEGSLHADGQLWRYNGVYQQRRREPGADVDTCFSGKIAVTLLSLA
jgi:5'-nucleotidase